MKFLRFFLLVNLSFASQTFARGQDLESILPSSKRICGNLVRLDHGCHPTYLLQTEAKQEVLLRGSDYILEAFNRISAKTRNYQFICIPQNPNEPIDSSTVFTVEWFVYIDPAASGISVVNQKNIE